MMTNGLVSTFLQCRELPPQFSHHNKGFINYVFCRNWAVRSPAGTRLDSSLVNKQVGYKTIYGANIHLAQGSRILFCRQPESLLLPGGSINGMNTLVKDYDFQNKRLALFTAVRYFPTYFRIYTGL